MHFKTSNVLETGVTSFIPLYPVRKGFFERIYAGGFHSFAVLHSLRTPPKMGPENIKLDSQEVVYSDTAMVHRFLRFSVPYFKPDEQIGITEMAPENVVELLRKELDRWKRSTARDKTWAKEIPLLDYNIQIDEDITRPNPRDSKNPQILCSGFNDDKSR